MRLWQTTIYLAEAIVSTLKCSPAVLRAMTSIFSAGVQIGHLADLQDILVALRTWQANNPVADVCEARILINERKWYEAAQLLQHVTANHRNMPLVSALYALCLYMSKDPEWRRCARETVASGNSSAIAIVARFLNVPTNTGHGPAFEKDIVEETMAAIETRQPDFV